MAMDFFGSQDVARKKTGKLVFLFILAVIAIIITTYIAVVTILGVADVSGDIWNPALLGIVCGGTILIVGGGSLYKISQFSQGGQVVAEHLGGMPISPDTKDPLERKVLNVVEEMSIASGVPTPPVYIMNNEQGINAFAAGYATGDAVIGVTRGCVERLTRDQLQGVIAHEFSHILNGDMRLNIRLIGVIHGILVIGMIGYFVFRMALYSGHGRSRSRDKDSNPVPLLALGAALMAIGFLGTLFGNLIKAAVSRQREFLADASAVQFTRNPEGIGGALKAIGGFSEGSKIESPNAPEASHMFFGSAISGFAALFATHPPLPERIKRIFPSWDGSMPDTDAYVDHGSYSAASGFAPGASGLAPQTSGSAPQTSNVAPESSGGPPPLPESPSGSAIASIGEPTMEHLAYAQQLLAEINPAITQVAHETYGARALLYAMLINDEAEPRQSQLDCLAQNAHPGVFDLTKKLLPLVDRLDPKTRLPLIDIAIPALRSMSPHQYHNFANILTELVKADKKIDMFEWCLQRILTHHLEAHFSRKRSVHARYRSLSQVSPYVQLLLSTLAHVGNRDPQQADSAFNAAARAANLTGLTLLQRSDCSLTQLAKSLDQLNQLSPSAKRDLLQAAATCIAADNVITISEAELFRAIADSLDCPMPPLLPGQPLV